MAEMTEQPAQADSEISEDRLASALYGSELPEDNPIGDEQTQPEQAGEQAAPEGEETPAEPELADVDFNGKQYKLPPELKDALMAQADYTKKTQEVAEARRLVDLQALTIQQQTQFQNSVAQELQTLGQLDMEIARYAKLDWASLDTDTLVRARHALDQLKDQKQQIQSEVQNKHQQFQHGMQALMAEARDKGNEYLKRTIPSWGPEIQKELSGYGVKEGYSDVELNSLTDARMIKTLWKASQWDKLQSQKGATQQKVTQAPPVVRPGAVNNNNQANRDRAFKSALKSAKTNSQKLSVLDQRIAEKFL